MAGVDFAVRIGPRTDAGGYTRGLTVYQILTIRDRSRIDIAVKDPSSPTRLVRRRCLVCDAEQDLLEPAVTDEIGPSCSDCGAPTERVAILRDKLTLKNPHAVALGRLGGLKGGPARAQALTPQRRRELARRAVLSRWRRAKRKTFS